MKAAAMSESDPQRKSGGPKCCNAQPNKRCDRVWSGLREHMRRRAFITLLGGAAAWPVVVRAQQGERMRRVGVLMNLAADDSQATPRISAFVKGLQELGWKADHNLQIATRWAAADA